jgi:UDPglucose 6-dehydrogenase
MGKENNFEFSVLNSAISSNNAQVEHIVQTIVARAGDAERVIGIWGLTFKAGTDDRRNSPALNVVKRLLELGFVVRAYDPTVTSGGAPDLDGIEIVGDAYDAAQRAALIVLLTEWPEFRELDWSKISDVMVRPIIYDTRNILNRGTIVSHGIEYCSVGTV